jgi:hypothetical protein
MVADKNAPSYSRHCGSYPLCHARRRNDYNACPPYTGAYHGGLSLDVVWQPGKLLRLSREQEVQGIDKQDDPSSATGHEADIVGGDPSLPTTE